MTNPPDSTQIEPPRKSAAVVDPMEPTKSELGRLKAFIFIQVLFLGLSPFAGGFHYKLWSMLDTSLLVLSIGISALAFVVETRPSRRLIFRTAAIVYVCSIVDMSVNILLSGVLGWHGVDGA
ncbi:MAG: hypothetical protein ACPG31_01590 [Planctomycetota bacterium]